jgi:hypothetical protein
MVTKKITPEIVKKIELSLEERKLRQDRRKAAASQPPAHVGSERRTGKDRRNESD